METKKTNKANLENKKFLFFEIGLAIALLGVFYAFEWNSYDVSKVIYNPGTGIEIPIDEVPITRPDEPEQPNVQPPVISDVITITDDPDTPPFVLPDPEVTDKPVDIRDYMEPKKAKEEEEVDEVLPPVAVEEKPTFMGGDESTFSKWVFSQLIYPEEAQQNHIQGKVICSFIIDKEGNLIDIQIVRGIDASLDREAIRVLNMSPKWTPGKQRGKPVKVKYTFPINFQLR